jgi:hypothetical protein
MLIFNCVGHILSNDRLILNDELERMRKEVVIACYEILYKHFTEKTEDSLKSPVMINSLRTKKNHNLWNFEVRVLAIQSQHSICYFKLSAVNVSIIPHFLTDIMTSVDKTL